jgi:hypothetical protein
VVAKTGRRRRELMTQRGGPAAGQAVRVGAVDHQLEAYEFLAVEHPGSGHAR